MRAFEDFYNEHRPHQGIANARPLRPLPPPVTDPEQIVRLDIRKSLFRTCGSPWMSNVGAASSLLDLAG
jgi:hypothetical protein